MHDWPYSWVERYDLSGTWDIESPGDAAIGKYEVADDNGAAVLRLLCASAQASAEQEGEEEDDNDDDSNDANEEERGSDAGIVAQCDSYLYFQGVEDDLFYTWDTRYHQVHAATPASDAAPAATINFSSRSSSGSGDGDGEERTLALESEFAKVVGRRLGSTLDVFVKEPEEVASPSGGDDSATDEQSNHNAMRQCMVVDWMDSGDSSTGRVLRVCIAVFPRKWAHRSNGWDVVDGLVRVETLYFRVRGVSAETETGSENATAATYESVGLDWEGAFDSGARPQWVAVPPTAGDGGGDGDGGEEEQATGPRSPEPNSSARTRSAPQTPTGERKSNL